jgi:uncharacterized protein (TIGR02597 family)
MNVTVRRLPLLLLSVAGILSAQILHAQSVATNPVGYNMLTLPAGNNVRVNTFVQATVFQGTASAVTSASNSLITLSGSATALTSGSYNEVNGEPTYYVEILDTGSAQGLIADIVSNGTNTVTVDTNLIPFGTSTTCSFLIRPHTTLSSLFPASTAQLTAYTDSIKLFFPDNSSVSYLFTGTGTGWVNAGTFAAAGAQIIYPGQGFIISTGSAETVPVTGYVKPGPTQVPLYAGAINLVGTVNPVISGTQTLSNFNFPSIFTAYSDSVKLFSDTGALQSPGSYLSSGTNMINAGTFVNSDSVTVNPSNAVIVSVGQSKNWVMPSFYTSGN